MLYNKWVVLFNTVGGSDRLRPAHYAYSYALIIQIFHLLIKPYISICNFFFFGIDSFNKHQNVRVWFPTVMKCIEQFSNILLYLLHMRSFYIGLHYFTYI